MQDIYNLKIFEMQKLNESVASCKRALFEIEDKIDYLEKLCINETNQKIEDKKSLLSKKSDLQKELIKLENDKEQLNEELVDKEVMSELIKMKYALLLSNYAAYHDNPGLKPKKEVKTLIQKLLNFTHK